MTEAGEGTTQAQIENAAPPAAPAAATEPAVTLDGSQLAPAAAGGEAAGGEAAGGAEVEGSVDTEAADGSPAVGPTGEEQDALGQINEAVGSGPVQAPVPGPEAATNETVEQRARLYWMNDMTPAEIDFAFNFIDAVSIVKKNIDLIYPPDSGDSNQLAERQAVIDAIAQNDYIDDPLKNSAYDPKTQKYTDANNTEAYFTGHFKVLIGAIEKLANLENNRPAAIDPIWKSFGEGGRLVTLKNGETKLYEGAVRSEKMILVNLRSLLLLAVISTKEGNDFNKQSDIFHKLLAVNLILSGPSKLPAQAQIEIASQVLEDLVKENPGFLDLQYDDIDSYIGNVPQKVEKRGVLEMYAEARTKAAENKGAFAKWLYEQANLSEAGLLNGADSAELAGKRALNLLGELELESFNKQNQGRFEKFLTERISNLFGNRTEAIRKIAENPGRLHRINTAMIGSENIGKVSPKYRQEFYRATGIDINEFRKKGKSLSEYAISLSPWALIAFGVVMPMFTEEEGGQPPPA